jgi:hypothetical protein
MFVGCAALRVSYSQRAVLRVSYSQQSGAECMMLSECAGSMIVPAPPADSMILSALCDHVIMLLSGIVYRQKKKLQSLDFPDPFQAKRLPIVGVNSDFMSCRCCASPEKISEWTRKKIRPKTSDLGNKIPDLGSQTVPTM